jgi:hypothetical protein
MRMRDGLARGIAAGEQLCASITASASTLGSPCVAARCRRLAIFRSFASSG